MSNTKTQPDIIWTRSAYVDPERQATNTLYAAEFGNGDMLLMFNVAKSEVEGRIRESLDLGNPMLDPKMFSRPVKVDTIQFKDQVYLWRNMADQLQDMLAMAGIDVQVGPPKD